ncbi:MAG: 23S rRNA (adenine(2503)-C(2))-methyltransferase RlmN [Clostridia bacterium]|nr:23S rRNA (adenine(2503)-C(2))-methyltransferase RlmN [Clostridia bacterium]
MPKTDIKSMTLDELARETASSGLPSFRAGQIFDWLQVRGATDFEEMTNLPKSLRAELAQRYELRSCTVVRRLESKDDTVKYLFRLIDGECVESVLMHYKYGYTLCVSSQVGCKMGCAFCASTLGGFVRSLTASEILSQIHAAQRDRGVRVSHVVLMGMGEPLDNFDNVMRFLDLVGDAKGLNLSMRNISLSTCGLVPRIYDLMERDYPLTLSISIHAPNDEIRSRIMPVNRSYPIEELLRACRVYAERTKRRISFEYTMIHGVNDSDACARELAGRLRGMLAHVNLIPANEFRESPYARSGADRVERFAEILRKCGVNATVRRSLGSDIDASCGQLRLHNQKEVDRT